MRTKVIVTIILFFIVCPQIGLAQTPLETGLNTAASEAGLIEESQDTQDAQTLVGVKVGSYIKALLSFLGVIFLLIIIYAGILWMTAGGTSEQVSKAKRFLINAAIGLALVLLAYSIANYVISRIGEAAEPTPEEEPVVPGIL